MARHGRRYPRRAFALGILALLSSQAAAFAHPFGQKPVALIRRIGTVVDVTWVIAPDDVRALGTHTGVPPVRPEAYPAQPAMQRYFRRNLVVEHGGERCDARLVSVGPVATGYLFRTAHECSADVTTASVRLTLLQDVDPNYQTLYEAVTPVRRLRGVFTVATPSVVIDFAESVAAPSPGRSPAPRASRADRILAMLQGGTGSVSFAAALGLAFVLGALHGLTPGHGKTITAAYLVGAGGTVRQALALGGMVSATHALSVGLLGGITVALGALQPDSKVGAGLELAAGMLIVGLGLSMFIRRGAHGDEHAHEPTAPTARRLAAIGFVGGLVPGPEAVAIALVAFSVGRWATGVALIVAFSLGLAAVVLGIAVAAVRGAGILRRLSGGALAAAAPRIAAVIFLAMGVVVTVNGARRL